MVCNSINPAIEAARGFIEAGYAVIPIKPSSKEPLNNGGSSAPCRTWAEFERYVLRCPLLNFAVLTGNINKLVVIDVDGKVGFDSLQNLHREGMQLPPTVQVLTGKGSHHYFYCDNTDLTNRIKWLPGVDIRAKGGYVVGAHSLHQNGTRYRYRPGASFQNIRVMQLPNWLEQRLSTKRAFVAAPEATANKLICEGERNSRLTKLAGKLRNADLDADAIQRMLLDENERRCSPPLDTLEVVNIAQSVARYDVRASDGDEGEAIAEMLLQQQFAGGAHILYASDGKFWRYSRTHWVKFDFNLLRKSILQLIQGLPDRPKLNTSRLLEQVVVLLKARCATANDLLRFNSDPPLAVNCKNCELWFSHGGDFEARPHRHDSYFRHRLDVEYDSSAVCPIYNKTTYEIFSRCDAPQQMMTFWDELIGYIMQPHRPRPYIVIGSGEGSNGKTSFAQFIVRLIGPDQVAAIPVQELDKSRFMIGSLDGKLLLLDDDVRAGTRLPDGQLKRLSEEKSITGEHKYGPPFSFRIRALPLLLCNNMPSVSDLSAGLRRRLLVVPFDRHFSEKEIDVDVFSRIAKHEMSGVFNRYLAGLARVIRADWAIERPLAVQRATAKFLEGANPLATFIAEECERSGSCLVRDLYERYESWRQASGVTFRLQRTAFTKGLEKLDYNIRHASNGDRVVGLSPTQRRSGIDNSSD